MREWVRASKPANGPTVVTATVSEGNLTAKYSVKAYGKTKAGVAEALGGAKRLLGELQEAVEDVQGVEAA